MDKSRFGLGWMTAFLGDEIMRGLSRCAWGLALLSGPVLAAPTEFDFTDPKRVNSISFMLDSMLEPIVGLASGVKGKLSFDPASPTSATGAISVETKNLMFANKGLQDTAHGPDWLDAGKNPKIEFTFKKVTEAKPAGEGVTQMTVVGDMSCNGVTKEVTVAVKATYLAGKLSERQSKGEGDLLVLRSNFTIKRSDFNIKKDMSDKVVADEISVQVAIVGSSPKK